MRKILNWMTVLGLLLSTFPTSARADQIRGINLDFVTIGSPGNLPDTGGTAGCGSVDYDYRIGKYEITNAQWNAFVAAVGAPTGNPASAYEHNSLFTGEQEPANCVSWYEAAQFCNYLTSGDNTNPGNFLGINRDAAQATYGNIYFLPTENEWYKAAYYKPSGAGYSLYSSGSNSPPDQDVGWNVYGGTYGGVWNVGTGYLEQNGTYDMMGNVAEWTESIYSTTSYYIFRGGHYGNTVVLFSAATRQYYYQYFDWESQGFRIAAYPVVCDASLGGDWNSDCTVDMQDFAILAQDWLNGFSGTDFVLMSQNWLINCIADPGDPACIPGE